MSGRHPVLEELLRAVPPPRTEAQRASAKPPAARPRPARRAERRRGRRATRKCTYVLPRDLAQELRVLCAIQDVTQREVVEQLVREYVGRHQRLLPE